MNKVNNLDGQVAVVTGCNGQLGTIYCEALLKNGAKLIATDIHDSPNSKIARILSNFQNIGCYEKMDITSEKNVKDIFDQACDQKKQIDILINNAGTMVFDEFSKRKKSDFMRVMEVNIFGTFNCINAVTRHMKQNKNGGSIVNIGSIYGVVSGDPRIYTDCSRNVSEVYSASKAAVIQLTKYFAIHLSDYQIRVNSLSPGGVFNKQGDDFIKNYSNRVPMNRMAEQDEMVSGLLYLANNKLSSYVNGHNLIIDGGLTSW